MEIARVFPRKTTATPDDELSFFGLPPLPFPEVDEVHISVTFSYDITKAMELAEKWRDVAPVKMGGPAVGDRGEEFTPGVYTRKGYVITSRGCPNNCWFCDVPRREGELRELPITQGWNLLDANILACSEDHVEKVFNMLKAQPERPQLTGGLEAARLTDWHVAKLWELRPAQMFFAYDTPNDLEPLIEAGKKLRYANFTRQHLRCYVLIGWPKDSFEAAEERLLDAWGAGFLPMAMLWKNEHGDEDTTWRQFQRLWARPAITKQRVKEHYLKHDKKGWD